MDLVRVRVVRTLTDMRQGDEAWVEDSPRVRGMVAGGYFVVIGRQGERVGRSKKVASDGADQAEPVGDASDA